MSPEFYAIIGVGVGLASLGVGLAGLMLYLVNQANQRIDRLETQTTQRIDRLEAQTTQRIDTLEAHITQRIDRLEDRFIESIDQVREQVHSLDKRVSKLEWMFEAEFGGGSRPSELSEE